jgi:hypothetical protein
MAKYTSGFCLIVVSEMFFQFTCHSIVLQLRGSFQKHLCPHHFIISTFKAYEAIPFGIWTLLNLHPDWAMMQIDVKNTFNNVFQVVIFKEMCDVKGPLVHIILFTKLFFDAHLSLYY